MSVRFFESAVVVAAMLALTACSSAGGHASSPSTTTPVALGTSRSTRASVGFVQGRMYADGGPGVCTMSPPTTSCGPAVRYEPVHGSVTFTPVGSTTVAATVQPDSRGRFRASLSPGQYEVVGYPHDFGGPLKLRVKVLAGRTVPVDLGIHMS